jgi:uncharacterized 2Fe-2S/4Fe-4S cluster protein (DUF4445 family)
MDIRVIESGRQQLLQGPAGDNLLVFLRRNHQVVHAPCGGRGTCGKCTVEIDGIGPVLACQVSLSPDLWAQAGLSDGQTLTVRLPDPVRAQISTGGILPDLEVSPLVYRGTARLPSPRLDDQRPDDRRLADATGKSVPFYLLPELPVVLRESNFAPTFWFRGDTGQILRFVGPDDGGPLGMALDIGTTTLAAYLCDLGSGRQLASASMLNPQRSFGADVISRIEQAAAGHRADLQRVLARAVGELSGRLLELSGRQSGRTRPIEDIAHLVIAGNTTMVHLLAALPADAIARTPFIPVTVSAITASAAELGLPLHPAAVCQILPAISGYVGADVTAGLLACGFDQMAEQAGNTLFLDIGTNGEIVLATPGGLIACSTAAGPAFEGANITCGLGGVDGAIDRVFIQDGDLACSLIGPPGPARGLCGSGLVAAVAMLLDLGLLDETGRITDDPEQLAEPLRRRLARIDGQEAIILLDETQSATGRPVFLTQKDIRELQNAKAAISAGIALLIEQAGLKAADIERVYMAGGFGNYLGVDHALRIGLLPSELKGRTVSAGNTAGMGALACLLNAGYLERSQGLADRVRYFELSADRRFTDLYIDAMIFPEPE